MQKLEKYFNTKDFRVFLTTMFLFGLATGLFSGTMNNYLAEILGIDRFERGVVEFIRELPGLCLILILALLYRHSENQIIRVALFMSFLGVAGIFLLGANPIFGIIFIMIWSTGEHIMMPVRHSIAIHSAQPDKEGLALGITGSFRNIGQVAGYYLVPIILIVVRKFLDLSDSEISFSLFRAVFVFSGIFLLIGILFTFRFHKSDFHVKKQRLYFRKKYFRYYILEMFFGARKQVFLTFAPFVLILNYNASTELIAMLYGIFSLINIFINPLMGKLIDKIGYRIILICDALLLIVICILYGFSHHFFQERIAFFVICVIFIIDGMLFIVGMARSLYVKTIARDQGELTATLSTGISINHLISIIVALLGGLLWENFGIELLFICAACFGFGAFVFSWFLPKPAKVLK